MNAIFPSSRPNISVRVIPKIPSTLVGAGGIGVSKENGQWTIEPAWDDLALIAPGILLDPTSKEIWVHDPVTDVYNRMTLGGLGQALFWGTSSTPVLIGSGTKSFVTQSGKDWPVGSFIQAFSTSAIANFVIGQVTGYSGTDLTVNVLAIGGSGTVSDWTIVPSTLPGAGAPGADGAPGGLNYNFTAGISGDPGSGNIGFNSATLTSIVSVRVSHFDRMGVNILSELETWDDSTTLGARAKIRVGSPGSPNKFVIATINGPIVNFPQYVEFPLISPVGTTMPDVGNCQVEIYRTGDKGEAGDDGAAAGGKYIWNVTIDESDPFNGMVKINNGSPSVATRIYVFETTIDNQDVAAVIASWDDSTQSNNRGTLVLLSLTDQSHFIAYRVIGNIVDHGAWAEVPVAWISGSGGFAPGEELQITFARSGDIGEATLLIADDPPPLPSHGQQWFESSTGMTYVFYDDGTSAQWVQTNGNLGGSGGGGGIADAPVDTLTYGRNSAAWVRSVAVAGDTMIGDLAIQKNDPIIALKKQTSGQRCDIDSWTGSTKRWTMRLGSNDIEAGANQGSNFQLYSWADGGSSFVKALDINRVDNRLTLVGPPLSDLHAATKKYVDDNVTPTSTFTQSGAGAVARTYQSKMADAVNAKDFGVDMTGATDSAAALLNAISHAQATTGIVYVPPGLVRLNSAVWIPPGVSLIGSGMPAATGAADASYPTASDKGTWFFFNHSDYGFVVHGVGTLYVSDQARVLQGFGTYRTQPAPGVGAYIPNQSHQWDITVFGANDVLIADIMLLNATRGIYVGTTAGLQHGSMRIIFRRIYGQPLLSGIYIEYCYDCIRIEEVHFWSFWAHESQPVLNWTFANATAIRFGRCDNPQVDNVFCYGYATGIHITFSPELLADILPAGTLNNAQFGKIQMDAVGIGLHVASNASVVTACFDQLVAFSSQGLGLSPCSFYIESNFNVIRIKDLRSAFAPAYHGIVSGSNNRIAIGTVVTESSNPAYIHFFAFATNRLTIDTVVATDAAQDMFVGGDGIISCNVWRSYVVALSSTSGGPIVISPPAVSRYRRVGDTVDMMFNATISNNNGGGGLISMTLPVPTSADSFGCAVGIATGQGKTITVSVPGANSPIAYLINYDNSYPGVNGVVLAGTITYRCAA